MERDKRNCNHKNAPDCTYQKTICDYLESSDDDGKNRNGNTCKRIISHLVVNEHSSNLDDIKHRTSLKSLKTLNEMNLNKVKFLKETDKKLKRADYFTHLKSMTAAGIRPNVVLNFKVMDLLLYSTILYYPIPTISENETAKREYVQLYLDRVSPKYYKRLFRWMTTDKPIHLGCLDLLDVIDPWTFLYRNIRTEQYYDYYFDKSLFNYKAFLMFWETRRRNYKYGCLFLNNRIKECFLDLVANDQFVLLDIKEVRTILNSTTIGVNSEVETFMAAVHWLNHDWEARKQHALKIMECIRFKLIAPWLLIPLVNDEAEEIRRVTSIYSIVNLINGSMEYGITRMSYMEENDPCVRFIIDNIIATPLARSWIYDKNCSHHHKLGCDTLVSFGYKDFMKYLSELRLKGRTYWKQFTRLDSDKCPCGKSPDEYTYFRENIFNHLLTIRDYNLREDHDFIVNFFSKLKERKEPITSPSSEQQKDVETLHKRNQNINNLQRRLTKYFLGLTNLSQLVIGDQPCKHERKAMKSKSNSLSYPNVSLENDWHLLKTVLRFRSSQCCGRKQAVKMEDDIKYKYQKLKIKKLKEMRQQNLKSK